MPEEFDNVERLLDAALEQTFPASDPIAVDVTPRTEPAPAGVRQLPSAATTFTFA